MQELIIAIIINYLDVLIIYYICHNLMDKKLKFSINLITIGVLYGVILGVLSYYLDGYLYRIISTLIILIIFKWLLKRKIQEVVVLYAIYFICVSFIQLPLIIIIVNIRISQTFTFLLVQVLTLLISMFLDVKVPLHRLLNLIEKEVLLKICILNLAGILIVTLFYGNYDYTNSYLLYFMLLTIVACIGIYQTRKRLSFYTHEMPAQVHDVKNILTVLQILAHNSADKELKGEIEAATKILGLEANSDDMELEGFKESILAMINKKMQDKQEPIILTDINYSYSNSKAGILAIGYMLSVLLDNAIETGTKKPILVIMKITEDVLILSVANEYERKASNDIQNMFEKRYSTKRKAGRGHGLPNLSQFVYKHQGEILTSYEYNHKQACHYLIMTIEMGNWKIWSPVWIESVLSL